MSYFCKYYIINFSEDFTIDEKGKEIKVKRPHKEGDQRPKLTFLQYVEKMHKLSLTKRKEIVDYRKNYCKHIDESIAKSGKK